MFKMVHPLISWTFFFVFKIKILPLCFKILKSGCDWKVLCSFSLKRLSDVFQEISAVAKAWVDGPYLFIVKVQPAVRGLEIEDILAEQLNFAFTSESQTICLENSAFEYHQWQISF